MVGINPVIRQINFGADAAPITVPIIPAQITGNPIQERHGYMESNLYGTPDNRSIAGDYNYDKYLPHSHEEYKSNLVSTALMAGGVGVAILLLFMGAKKFIFKPKDAEKGAEYTKKNVKDIRPPETGLQKFDEIYKSAIRKKENDDMGSIKLADLRVIFTSKQKAENKKEYLNKLFEYAKIYSQKDRQAKVWILMPESMENKANYIVDMFSKNKIDKVDKSLLEQIEGFQIVNAGKVGLEERSNMIVYHQVAHSVNASDVGEVAGKWWRNLKGWVREWF